MKLYEREEMKKKLFLPFLFDGKFQIEIYRLLGESDHKFLLLVFFFCYFDELNETRFVVIDFFNILSDALL